MLLVVIILYNFPFCLYIMNYQNVILAVSHKRLFCPLLLFFSLHTFRITMYIFRLSCLTSLVRNAEYWCCR